MGLLEMALWIPVNEGRWGRGCDGKQIKVPFAACLLDVLRAKFCSLIGPPSIVGGTQSSSLQRDPPTLEDTGMFAEGTGHLDAASGIHVS